MGGRRERRPGADDAPRVSVMRYAARNCLSGLEFIVGINLPEPQQILDHAVITLKVLFVELLVSSVLDYDPPARYQSASAGTQNR